MSENEALHDQLAKAATRLAHAAAANRATAAATTDADKARLQVSHVINRGHVTPLGLVHKYTGQTVSAFAHTHVQHTRNTCVAQKHHIIDYSQVHIRSGSNFCLQERLELLETENDLLLAQQGELEEEIQRLGALLQDKDMQVRN